MEDYSTQIEKIKTTLTFLKSDLNETNKAPIYSPISGESAYFNVIIYLIFI